MALGRDESPMRLRYGMRHTWRCECSTCVATFERHERAATGILGCDCEDCANTRLWRDFKRNAEIKNETASRTSGQKYLDEIERVRSERMNTVATVNFCERHTCETMAKSPAMGMVVIVPVTSGPENIYADAVHTTDRDTVRMELCPGCVGELMDWVNALPTGDRPKAYSKPWKRGEGPDKPQSSAELFRLALEASKREMESGEVPEA